MHHAKGWVEMKRRDFLKVGTGALGWPGTGSPAESEQKEAAQAGPSSRKASARPAIKYPRVFTGRQLAMISFP
ncbi:MAG: hypothetical protein DMG10_31365, partial [Acidobacteria bacterium]